MFFEKLKQYFFLISEDLNIFISKYINDGVKISGEKFNLILIVLVILILLMFFCVWLWREKIKNMFFIKNSANQNVKSPKSFSEIDKKSMAKDEHILNIEKERSELAKTDEKFAKDYKALSSEQKNNQIKETNHNDLSNSFNVVSQPEQNFLFFDLLKERIGNTRKQLLTSISNVILGKKQIDSDLLDSLEEVLISSDIGPETTLLIIKSITEKVSRKELTSPEVLQEEVQNEILKIMDKKYPKQITSEKNPLILLIVGVNGVGKTTTIGKIASQYRQKGKKVLMGAADTFRAAAIEQLLEWSKRADCDILHKDPGSDPSSVIHETVQKGINESFDVVICDTAGRLHTKKNLMEELKKMVRVIQNLIPDAPHEILMVLDATTGQNAIFQTREFKEATNLTGLIITKLDGTSKGGVVIGIVNEFDIPVRYIGIGEQVEDLRAFDPKQFTESIFN